MTLKIFITEINQNDDKDNAQLDLTPTHLPANKTKWTSTVNCWLVWLYEKSAFGLAVTFNLLTSTSDQFMRCHINSGFWPNMVLPWPWPLTLSVLTLKCNQ